MVDLLYEKQLLFLNFSNKILSWKWFYLQQKRVGTLPKDKFTGKIIDEWKKALENSNKKIEEVDVSAGIASVLAVKDEEEVVSLPGHSKVTKVYC